MATLGKILLAAGLALAFAGVVFLVLARARRHPVSRRPCHPTRELTLYAPTGLMIGLGVLLTIVLNLIARR